MTVLEVIQRSSEFLGQKGVESPRLQVELLLAHVLKVPRMQLYLKFERLLTAEELDQARKLIRRRAQREPLQHIVGSTSFCGFEIRVNGKVLVPRPETELLAELGWEFLQGKTGRRENGKAREVVEDQEPVARLLALDFGTGSGCLAIALAVKSPVTKVYAVDICPDAIAVAKQNTQLNKADIQFFTGDGFSALPAGTRFELIVGNPPDIPSGEIAGLDLEVREHDPRLALDGGADGLDYYRRLAGEAGTFLNPDGRMMLEFGDGQAAEIQKLFEHEKWIVEAIKTDYNRRPRILVARRAE